MFYLSWFASFQDCYVCSQLCTFCSARRVIANYLRFCKWHASDTPEYISYLPTSVASIPGRSMPLIMWQPHRAADMSTDWRQSLFCDCTMCMKQAADGAETAVIDGLVSSWSENISVWFCLRGTRIWIDSVMHRQSSSRECNTSASVTVTVLQSGLWFMLCCYPYSRVGINFQWIWHDIVIAGNISSIFAVTYVHCHIYLM